MTSEETMKPPVKVKKVRKKRTSVEFKAIQEIFKDHQDLLGKLHREAEKSFRTPSQQLIYYTWKSIDFMK